MDVTQQDVDRAIRIADAFRRRFRWRMHASDVHSAALEGLADATRNYDVARHSDFWSYATTRILGAVRDDMRRCDHLTRDQRSAVVGEGDSAVTVADGRTIVAQEPIPLDAAFVNEEGDVGSIIDTVGGPDKGYASVDACDAIRRVLRRLDLRERFAILAVDGYGYKNLAVAEAFGVTEARVSQLRSAGLKQIRAELADCWLDAA